MYTAHRRIEQNTDFTEQQRKKKPMNTAVSDLPHTPPAPILPNVVQKIRYDSASNSFLPGKRPIFEAWVMPAKAGKARCHTVSAFYIQQFIVSWLNDTGRNPNELLNFVISLDAVSEDAPDKDMLWAYWATCKDYVTEIWKALTAAPPNYDFAAQQATELLSIAASATHNLRYGAPGTNSSIGNALDLPTDSVMETILAPGRIVLNERGEYVPLKEPLPILLLPYNSTTAQRILPLVQSGRVDVSVYTTGNTIISSDNFDQNRGSTLPAGNLPFGVENANGSIILFDTN